MAQKLGYNSLIATPMLREDAVVGAILTGTAMAAHSQRAGGNC